VSEKPHLTVSVKGDDAMTGAVKVGAATLELLDAITEVVAPESGLRRCRAPR
jgi:hypothetical protein